MADKPKKFHQIYAGLSATIGGFLLGNNLGWSSPAEKMCHDEMGMSESDFAWVASVFLLGAACAALITIFMDLTGRKWCIIFLGICSAVPWIVMIFFISFYSFVAMRILAGFFTGGFCVVVPAFIGEIVHKSLRGVIGVCFQLMITTGILYSYIFGYVGELYLLNLFCAAPPALLVILMIFTKESPYGYYKKKKVEKAEAALRFYRGKDYDIKDEMADMEKSTQKEGTFWQAFRQPMCYRAFIMILGMAIIQQLSGINAVIFFAHKIFDITKSNIDKNLSVVLLGVVQVVFTLVAAVVVDRIGRKMLWYISLSIMCFCQLLLGCYFTIYRFEEDFAMKIGVIPTIAVCFYIIGFSLGTGPLPWSMIGELLPMRVKSVCATVVTTINWLLAFVIVRTFAGIVNVLGMDIPCYFFAAVCLLAIFFILFVVLETQKKSLEEIQEEIQTGNPPPRLSKPKKA